MSTRAEALAVRILEGATALGEYAARLTHEEWNSIVHPDGRKVGVIVHHVASVYPIEIQLAQQIASGKAIEGVTWAAIAQMNAAHALENHNASPQQTIELLERNSCQAAEAVRNATEEELDRAVPVSLNADAPLTMQFMIEDHALRHSWHHLAKIKAALNAAHPAVPEIVATTVS